MTETALAECSECGAYVIVPPEHHYVLSCDDGETYQPYRYCPRCRRRVVDDTGDDATHHEGGDGA